MCYISADENLKFNREDFQENMKLLWNCAWIKETLKNKSTGKWNLEYLKFQLEGFSRNYEIAVKLCLNKENIKEWEHWNLEYLKFQLERFSRNYEIVTEYRKLQSIRLRIGFGNFLQSKEL